MYKRRAVVFSWLSVGLIVAALLGPAAAAAQSSGWMPGPGAILEPTYDGFIDAPANGANASAGGFTVAGWFVDRTAQGWAGADDVQVWRGTMDGGGTMLAKAQFAQNRPDVGAALGDPFWSASGFAANIAGGQLGTGAQTLSVYAHTPGKGWWFKQVNVNVVAGAVAAPAPTTSGGEFPVVAIEKPKDGEKVLTKSDYEIVGYAFDRAAAPNQGVAGSGIDRVDIWLGPKDDTSSIFLGSAELGFSNSTAETFGAQFGSAGWRLTFKPTRIHTNTYVMYAYAHSVVTGKEDSAQRFFAIRDS